MFAWPLGRLAKRFHRCYVAGNHGWILIDSMVGVLIITIALVAVVGTFVMANKSVTVSANRTQAIYIAQQSLEVLKGYDGTAQVPDPNDPGLPAVSSPFTRQITVNQNYQPNLSLVTVTLTWTDQSNTTTTPTNTVTMSSAYYRQ